MLEVFTSLCINECNEQPIPIEEATSYTNRSHIFLSKIFYLELVSLEYNLKEETNQI